MFGKLSKWLRQNSQFKAEHMRELLCNKIMLEYGEAYAEDREMVGTVAPQASDRSRNE